MVSSVTHKISCGHEQAHKHYSQLERAQNLIS